MTTIIKSKSNQVKINRIKKGLSTRAFYNMAGISSATLCKIENYNTSLLPQTAKKICEALELKFDDLFEIIETEKGA